MKNNESQLFRAMLGVGLSASTLFAVLTDKAEAHYDPAKHPNIEKIKKGASDGYRYVERKTKEGVDYIEKKIDDHEYKVFKKNRAREERERIRGLRK
jgi:hypothetical protein